MPRKSSRKTSKKTSRKTSRKTSKKTSRKTIRKIKNLAGGGSPYGFTGDLASAYDNLSPNDKQQFSIEMDECNLLHIELQQVIENSKAALQAMLANNGSDPDDVSERYVLIRKYGNNGTYKQAVHKEITAMFNIAEKRSEIQTRYEQLFTKFHLPFNA